MEPVTPAVPSRREKQRADTINEIKTAARDLLTESGPTGVSLRAIARTLGMSAPALYRYFPSLDALITALCTDLYTDLCQYMMDECDQLPETELVGRLIVAARGFRRWAVNHRTEFSLMFASLLPGALIASPGCGAATLDPETEPYKSMLGFSRIFGGMFNAIYHQTDAERGFTLTTPPLPPLTDALRDEVLRCVQAIGADVPIEYAYQFHSFWIRLYGLVAMEVFGQLPVLEQGEALLDAEIYSMAGELGVTLG